ncbi:hypothetical protein [Rathayibacter sp. VKM Ac-2927]|uniref:hypothetical protein n=1 Tax=Rathayibacter sp. VKM Ac-2927 TaxID=2929478 RepID=UPI001FB5277B|nr:hypothetical protein [Rathayibacter sp. VKM Ac-2927]MCJ1687760.1 hypothetical protein [Rathayibacter sp. VKM Ac-2927]
MPGQREKWAEVARLLSEGHTLAEAGRLGGVDWRSTNEIARRIEAGLPLHLHGRSLGVWQRNKLILEAAGTISDAQLAARFGISRDALRKVLAGAPERAAAPRPQRPAKSDPLFFRCGKGHALTRANIVAGTEKTCLVCAKKSKPMPFRLVPRRDALIAELLERIEREVAELTADLRPELAAA